MWKQILIRTGISCVAGLLLALLLIPLLPEAGKHHEAAAEEENTPMDEEREESHPEDIEAVSVEAVEIPDIPVPQEVTESDAEAVAEAEPEQIPATAEAAMPSSDETAKSGETQSDEPERILDQGSPPAGELADDPNEFQEAEHADSKPIRQALAAAPIALSDEELQVFIRTQTVNNRAKAFPRIHIIYENVDMQSQLGFYRSRGYRFFAVEIRNGVIAKLLGRIDETGHVSDIGSRGGLAWNYASVITRYRQIATEASGNPNAYLAVVPTYDMANLILGSIDKAINGRIDGDYRDQNSYRAIFTTRDQEAVLTVFIPTGDSLARHEILLNGQI